MHIFLACKLNKNEVKKFFVLKHYLNHLRAHEKNNELIKANCKKCGKLVDNAESLYLHMFECFENIALYQCAFCVFGTNLIDKIHDHLANCHPSKMSLICVRADNTPMKEGVKCLLSKFFDLFINFPALLGISARISSGLIEITL